MIIDELGNWRNYVCLHPGLEEGFTFLVKTFNKSMQDGRYELAGGRGYANVESYRTFRAEGRRFEAHRKYADIQTVVSGEEIIEWAPVPALDVVEVYSEDRDAAFYQGAGGITRLHLTAGRFAIFFPSDAHKPGCSVDGPRDVRKIVVKIKL
ncbi:MAG: YhcH/YjgK/YiaL family protein [Planctomycetota bacterium]